MKLVEVNFEDRKVSVWAEKKGNQLWMHYEGRTTCVDLKSSRTQSSQSGAGSGEIFAPMPGKILKVRTNIGDAVEAGKTLVVMEAMKMEYSLTADVQGTVKSVNCKEGDQVTKDSLLVHIESE